MSDNVRPAPTAFNTDHDLPQPGVAVDEWMFAVWSPDGEYGMLSGHRLMGKTAWYWSAHVADGHPLLHLTEFEVKVRPDWHVVKAPEMWAEHFPDDPTRQWSIGNEAYFAELEDADAALGRAYGVPRPTGFDLEWYAIGGVTDLAAVNLPTDSIGAGGDGSGGGFEQAGVVHGLVEVQGRPNLEVAEIPAYRWRRWTKAETLAPLQLDTVIAHTGLRAPFRFPDGSVTDWVVTPDGWRSRRRQPESPAGGDH